MLSAETSALVAGGNGAPAAQKPAQFAVRLLRAVMWGGKRVEAGSLLSVDRWQAAELITANKAERVEPAAVAPTPTAPAPAAKSTTAAKAAKEKP